MNGDEIEWYPEHPRLSEFLLGMLHQQAAWGGLRYATWCDGTPEQLGPLLDELDFVAEINSMKAYTAPQGAILALPWMDGPAIVLAATSQDRVDSWMQRLGLKAM